MLRRCDALVAGLGLVVALSTQVVSAQDGPPAAYTGTLRALIYLDRVLPDADRARLAEVVSQVVPLEYWRPTLVTKGSTLDRLVDCYYDAYLADPATRLTAQALKDALRRQNPLLEWPLAKDEQVRMLPFPATAERVRDPRLGTKVRTYDTTRDAYAVAKEFRDFTMTALRPVEPLTVSPSGTCDARLASRDSTSTAILVPTDVGRERLARERLPKSIFVSSVGDVPFAQSRIELLQDGGSEECLAHSNYLQKSPFWTDLRQLVAQHRDQLLAEADRFPLLIVDQNFGEITSGAEGHGHKVRKVFDRVFELLEIPALTRRLQNVELCPTDEKEVSALTSHVDALYQTNKSLYGHFKPEADTWLDERGSQCLFSEFDVPDLVLAAVLRKQLANGRWMSMSFRAHGSVGYLIGESFDTAASISLVAAGNDFGQLNSGWIPQVHASTSSHVILVTYGDDTGIVGTYSSEESGGPKVDVTAPGCGIGETWEAGSSLATPVVAAAVWLKELMQRVLGNAPLTKVDLRAEVTRASQLSASIGSKVMAAGMFDLSRYIVAPPRYILFRENAAPPRDQRLKVVSRGTVSVDCGTSEGPNAYPGGPAYSMLQTLTVTKTEDGKTRLLRRELGLASRNSKFVECTPAGPQPFLLTLTYADGRTEEFDWQKFTQNVLEVSF